MSYWVSLNCACCGAALQVENHSEGGTYAVGGTNAASLSVTYNYGGLFADALGYMDNPAVENFRAYLDGKKAEDVVSALEQAVAKLGTERGGDYWHPSPGNAGHALNVLLGWAKRHPTGVFAVH